MMEALIQSQSLYCSDQDFCPEAMARMFTINFEDSNQSYMCSAFLVAPDIIMTNSHCLWAGNIGLEKTCSGMYFAFSKGRTARCEKILWRDPTTSGRAKYYKGFQDFGLVKLDQALPIKPLSIVKQGLESGARVYPLVVDHQSSWTARITKLTCEVEKIQITGVAQLTNCPIIHGNSGAPIVNEKHEVVGIVFGSANNKIRMPNDELSIRTSADNMGLAFSMKQVQRILGSFLLIN